MPLSRHLKKKRIPEAPEGRAHPLEAIPMRKEAVEERISERGELHLHSTVPPSGLIERAMSRVTGTQKTIQIVLDEKGAFFWKQLDGEKNLFKIRRLLEAEYALTASESKEATILFTKMLMRRNLIQLQVDPQSYGSTQPENKTQ